MQNAGHHQPSGSITGTNCNSRAGAGGREFGREITNANAQTGSISGQKEISLPSVATNNIGGIQKKLGEIPASATAQNASKIVSFILYFKI